MRTCFWCGSLFVGLAAVAARSFLGTFLLGSPVRELDFSEGGRYLLAIGATQPTSRLYDVRTGQPLFEPPTAISMRGELSAPSQRLRLAPEARHLAILRASHFGRQPASAIKDTLLSPDLRKVAMWEKGEGPTTVEVWDLKGMTIKTRLPCSKRSATVFAPRGDRLAVIGGGVVQIYDLEKRQLLRLGPVSEARQVQFSTDGRHVAVEGTDTIDVWDTARGAHLNHLNLPKGRTDEGKTTLAFLSGTRELLATRITDDGLRHATVWNLSNARVLFDVAGLRGAVAAPNGTGIVLVDGRGALTLRDAEGLQKVWERLPGLYERTLLGKRSYHPSLIRFSPDSTHFAMAEGETVSLWNASTGTLEHYLHRRPLVP